MRPSALRPYGPAQCDIDQVTAWLGREGLTVNGVSPRGMSIDFAAVPLTDEIRGFPVRKEAGTVFFF